MCRWVAHWGETSVFLSEAITKPHNSIVKQSLRAGRIQKKTMEEWKLKIDTECLSSSRIFTKINNYLDRNNEVNGDGCGLGWYPLKNSEETSKVILPVTFKTITPAWNNRNLAHIAQAIEAKIFFAHIRAASPGSVVSEENCHPFIFGKFLWMHNGGVAYFQDIKKRIISLLSNEILQMIDGSTDSQYVGALFIENLPKKNQSCVPDPYGDYTLDELKCTLEKTINDILDFTCEIDHTEPPPSSLNFCVTDGKVMLASRFRNSTEDPPCLFYALGTIFRCNPDEKGIRSFSSMDFIDGESSKAVLISSEPLNSSNKWHTVPPNNLISIDEKGKVLLTPIQIQNVVSPTGEHKAICSMDLLSSQTLEEHTEFEPTNETQNLVQSESESQFQLTRKYTQTILKELKEIELEDERKIQHKKLSKKGQLDQEKKQKREEKKEERKEEKKAPVENEKPSLSELNQLQTKFQAFQTKSWINTIILILLFLYIVIINSTHSNGNQNSCIRI